jgi:hypothetical protein
MGVCVACGVSRVLAMVVRRESITVLGLRRVNAWIAWIAWIH